MIEKIISGAQTGVDRAGLDAAMDLGIPTGGWCPAGRRAVDGVIPEKYNTLTETKARSYSVRTGWNVRDSDATLIINAGDLEGGTELTVKYAEGQGKPFLVAQIEDPEASRKLLEWLQEVKPSVLNVAGPREEKYPGIHGHAMRLLLDVMDGGEE